MPFQRGGGGGGSGGTDFVERYFWEKARFLCKKTKGQQ